MSKLERLPYVFRQVTPQTTIVDIIEEKRIQSYQYVSNEKSVCVH